MDINAAFPSKYLKAHDLEDREHKLTIREIELENIGDDEKKPVLYFTQAKKGLVLNKTNAKAISAAYGKDTDQWAGKQVVLFSMMVQFRDDLVEGIRVKVPKAAKAPAQTVAAAQQQTAADVKEAEDPGADMDDDIPF